MVSLHSRQFVLPRALDREFRDKLSRLFGLYVVQPLLIASVAFVGMSAMFAWRGERFDLQVALSYAGIFGFGWTIMPFVLASERRRRTALLRKKGALRRMWRETEKEVERLRSSKNER